VHAFAGRPATFPPAAGQPGLASRARVHLVEFALLPGVRYSPALGYLHAAAAADPVIATRCEFRKHVVEQRSHEAGQDLERLLDRIGGEPGGPFALALTVCFWNRAASLELARRAKLRWPSCWVILGGNDVSYQQDALFAAAPWVDVLVHGEGELRFRDLLCCLLSGASDLSAIPGITYWAGADGTPRLTTTAPPPRIADLASVASPILSPVFADDAIASSSMIVYETNRGCPYRCAFCYWGGATNSKVRQFPLERVSAELDRIVRLMQPGATLFIADANFGIIGRDKQIAEILVDLCRRYEKKIFVTMNWAKNSSSRIIEIARILHDADLTGAITLSAQSFDENVLAIANRSNIRTAHYRRLLTEFRELGIPTYTDLIWGLPGESLDTHLAGVEEVLAAGGSPVIYPLLLLNNTDYTRDTYRTDHAIQVRRMPCDVTNPGVLADVVIGHARMSADDWRHGMQFRIALTLFQKVLLRCTLRLISRACSVRLVDLCQMLWDYLTVSCEDPYVLAIARDAAAAYRDPGRVNLALLHMVAGRSAIPEELHYQAILRRAVATTENTRAIVSGALGHLRKELGDRLMAVDQTAQDAMTSLDLAAAAIPRASASGKNEPVPFAVPADQWAMLETAGDVPMLPGRPVNGWIRGHARAPLRWTGYPLSVYALSVWHGTGRPLHDVDIDIDIE
jgi:Radical SAM superfamily